MMASEHDRHLLAARDFRAAGNIPSAKATLNDILADGMKPSSS